MPPRKYQNKIAHILANDYVLPETGKPMKLEDFQTRILNHVFTPRKDGRMPYRTVILSMPKKSGKTEIAAGIAYAWARHFGGEIYSCANDKDQSSGRMFDRIYKSLDWLKMKNKQRYDNEVLRHNYDIIELADPKTDRHQKNRLPYATIKALAVDSAGEAGAQNSLVVFDEIWGYKTVEDENFWEEMQPIPTIPHSTRLVVTYAGYYGISNLLYGIYERCLKPDPETEEYIGIKAKGLEDLPCYVDGSTFAYWDHVARMPWHTPEFLAAARAETRPSEYLRLWENRWTTGQEAFIDMELFDELCVIGDREGRRNHMLAIP